MSAVYYSAWLDFIDIHFDLYLFFRASSERISNSCQTSSPREFKIVWWRLMATRNSRNDPIENLGKCFSFGFWLHSLFIYFLCCFIFWSCHFLRCVKNIRLDLRFFYEANPVTKKPAKRYVLKGQFFFKFHQLLLHPFLYFHVSCYLNISISFINFSRTYILKRIYLGIYTEFSFTRFQISVD